MAAGTLYFSDMDKNSGVFWTNKPNVIGQYNVATAYTSAIGNNEFGGGNVTDVLDLPITLDSFLVRFWDKTDQHINDSYFFQVWVGLPGGWQTLETFNLANPLPSVDTEFDYIAAMQAKFNTASDKTVFMNGLQFRWACIVLTSPDNVQIATRGISIEYTFTFTGDAEFSIDATLLAQVTRTVTLGAVLTSSAPVLPRPPGYDPDSGTLRLHSYLIVVGHNNVYFGDF